MFRWAALPAVAMMTRESGFAINGSPSVSPDGGLAAFQRAVSKPEKPGLPFVYVIPLDGSKPERRVTRGSSPEVAPAWSPDGRRIALLRDSLVAVMDAGGGAP
jgi:Tol biopolymer transport system component